MQREKQAGFINGSGDWQAIDYGRTESRIWPGCTMLGEWAF